MEPDQAVSAGVNEATALTALRRLIYWQRRGLIRSDEARIVLKKQGIPDPIPLEFLSDGERMFLGRMACFYISGYNNALALAGRAETHFNDYWKPRSLTFLDKVSANGPATLLTTHSVYHADGCLRQGNHAASQAGSFSYFGNTTTPPSVLLPRRCYRTSSRDTCRRSAVGGVSGYDSGAYLFREVAASWLTNQRPIDERGTESIYYRRKFRLDEGGT